MNLILLSHSVRFPLKEHRSPEFVQRMRRLSKSFSHIFVLTHKYGQNTKVEIVHDEDSPNITLLNIQGRTLYTQIMTTRLIRQLNPCVLYSDTLTDANNALLHLLVARTKLVTTMRGWDLQVLTSELKLKGRRWQANLLNLIWPLRDFLVFKRSRRVLTVTRGLSRFAETRIGRGSRKRVLTVYRSMQYCWDIDSQTQNQAKEIRERFKSRLGVDPKILVTVARLSPGKRIDIAIDALEIIQRTIPETVLVIIGGGPEQENLEQYAKRKGLSDNVLFLGRVSRKLVLAVHEISDVMLFPSISEGFAKAPHEALIMGCPVVSYRFKGAEGLGFDKTCILIDKVDAELFADGAKRILTDSVFRKNLIRKGHALTKRYLSWSNDERVDFIAEILQKVVE